MSAIHRTLVNKPSSFDERATELINAGFVKQGSTQLGGPEGNDLVGSFINPGTETPKIVSDSVEINFGEVEVGEFAEATINVSGTNLTANIVATSQNGLVTVQSGSPVVPDEDGIAASTPIVLRYTPVDGPLTLLGYCKLTTTGGQTVNVILKGTSVIAP